MPHAASSETIRLIDDENYLRGSTARRLKLEGYAVLRASDAYRGLALLAAPADILTPPGQPIEVAGLPLEVQLAAAPGPSLAPEDERSLRNAEMQHIRRILREVSGNNAEAARVLGIAYTTLYRKIQEYGL